MQETKSILEPSVEDVATVVSILPIPLNEKKPGLIPGEYILNAVKNPHRETSILVVHRAKFPVYIDENRPSLIVPEPADRVCAAIVRDFKTSVSHYEPNVAEPGLFWTRGQVKSNQVEDQLVDELALARKLQDEWFKRLVAAADDDWERYHQRAMLSGIQKIACAVLKLERPWNLEAEATYNLQLVKCKFCQADVSPEAIVCMHCQGILNMDRYKAEFVSSKTISATP